MSFYDIYKNYKQLDLSSRLKKGGPELVSTILNKVDLSEEDLLGLLSPQAEDHLEEMAQKASRITLSNFGKAIQIYTPMYLSNYCENECVYCGFNSSSSIERRKLNLEEVGKEAEHISNTGIRHILILTGGSRKMSPVGYIKECVEVLKKYFSSISIEIYPLTEDEYEELIMAGVDGLTIYQETYNKELYSEVHLKGPKTDYLFRMDAPERAANKGIRTVNIGALFGLDDWRKEAFSVGLHAEYLQDKFPALELSVSLPRIRPCADGIAPRHTVTDKDIVQMVLALRIFLPRVGITLSTREDASFRDNLLPLGITKMSAGSTTAVGGHTLKGEGGENFFQFRISDKRDLKSMKKKLLEKGYQPVMHDWMVL